MELVHAAHTRPTVKQVETPTVEEFILRPGMMLCVQLQAPVSSDLVIPEAAGLDSFSALESTRALVLASKPHSPEHKHLDWTKDIKRGMTVHLADRFQNHVVRIDLRDQEELIGPHAKPSRHPSANFALLVDMGEVVSWDEHKIHYGEIQDMRKIADKVAMDRTAEFMQQQKAQLAVMQSQ